MPIMENQLQQRRHHRPGGRIGKNPPAELTRNKTNHKEYHNG